MYCIPGKKSSVQITGKNVIFPLPLSNVSNVSTEGTATQFLPATSDDQSTSFCRDENLNFFFRGIGTLYFSTLLLSTDT
jgi:hypothetical protein